MMHLSTAYVFEGDKRLAYNENDETNPPEFTAHRRSKESRLFASIPSI